MERKITILVLTLLATSFIAASVFAYYPLRLTVQPVQPPIMLLRGSNAGESDLGSEPIQVELGQNQTSVSIIIHPTYQTTYYKNITLISNIDNKAYNIHLILVSKSNNLPPGSKVWLIVYSKDTARDLPATYPQPGTPSGAIKVIELTNINTNNPQHIGSLNGNSMWEIDFMVYIPEGTSIDNIKETFQMHIAYTPSNETPP